jgi:hypothetical protein
VRPGIEPGSRAVFTQPALPFKCPGAPQKIVYLTADRLRRAGALAACDLQYFVHAPVVFGVPFFARELMKVVARYGIKTHFQQDLVAVDGAAKTATFEAVGGDDKHCPSSSGLPSASSRPALPLPDKPSIAVLPFQNMSGDPEQEYFADGIVEEIITALSRRFTGASQRVQVASSIVDQAVRVACTNGQPKDIATATGLVIQLYDVVKAEWDRQKAAQAPMK